jgi:S-formylglutathione hydrolase
MSAGRWTSTEINGKQADVFEPDTPREGRAVLHLHGHACETLKDNPVFSTELNRHGLRVICPHGKRSWWLPLICTEFDADQTPLDFVREDVVDWISREWNVKTPNIALTGISMGGQGVLQLAYRAALQFPVMAAISPAVDFHNWVGRGLPLDEMFDDREAARQHTAILQLHPLNWPRHQLLVCDPTDTEWIESAERLGSKLYSTGIPFESDFESSHGGHSWDYFNAMAPRVMDFVAAGLEQESLRLV